MSLKAAIAIPARYGSTRFPGKPLVSILDKPMIQWVWEACQDLKLQSLGIEAEVYVLTDDDRIYTAVRDFGGKCRMTAPEHPSGTDRIWAGLQDLDWDVVINVQGDEPLIPGALICELLQEFQDSKVQMVTAAHPLNFKELKNPNSVKVIRNAKGDAIYFSRFPIPFSRAEVADVEKKCGKAPLLRHIGIYGYRRDTIKAICHASPSWIEMGESLEQLRALDLGIPIRVVECQYQPVGVDSPEDLQSVIDLLTSK